MRRAQISFEYLVIVGIAIMVIVPTLLFFLTFTGTSEDSVSHSRVNEIGLEMMETAQNVYALGKHSWLTLDVNVPDSVNGFYISDIGELIIQYDTKHGPTDAVFYLTNHLVLLNKTNQGLGSSEELNIITSGRPGIMSFRFTSRGANVTVKEITG